MSRRSLGCPAREQPKRDQSPLESRSLLRCAILLKVCTVRNRRKNTGARTRKDTGRMTSRWKTKRKTAYDGAFLTRAGNREGHKGAKCTGGPPSRVVTIQAIAGIQDPASLRSCKVPVSQVGTAVAVRPYIACSAACRANLSLPIALLQSACCPPKTDTDEMTNDNWKTENDE